MRVDCDDREPAQRGVQSHACAGDAQADHEQVDGIGIGDVGELALAAGGIERRCVD
jgi:hypothetical protein